jgi:hypothetical protein
VACQTLMLCLCSGVCVLLAASNEWSSISVSGLAPSVRSGHTAVYHAASHRIIIYGGQQLSVTANGEMDMKFHRDVWALDCSQCRSGTVAHATQRHAACCIS